MGAQSSHHAQQEAMRRAAEDAERMRKMQEEANKAYEAQLEQMRKQAEALKPPKVLNSTIDPENVGVRTKRSSRGTTTGMSKGAASLRIPLNLGGSSGSGLNIG
jgi:excinuclease UvrABC helicase subunit UvrB